MSDAAWCNINDKETNLPFQIGHPFNGEDPDREHFTKTRKVNVETGNTYGRPTYQERQEVTEILDMCGYHARKQAGLFQNDAQEEKPAIEAVEAECEESEAEMWKAKYEAERAANARRMMMSPVD